MSRNYKFWNQNKPYFLSFSTVNWVDVFTRRRYKDIVIESLNYCTEHKELIVYGWVLMSNHVHLIMGAEGKPMQDIVRDFKRHTSKTLIKTISENVQESRRPWMLAIFGKAGKDNPNNQHYQLWQQHNQPIELDTSRKLYQKLDYLHQNPVKAGWVEQPREYLYSSARDYCGKQGLVTITKVRGLPK